jgi:MHS family proline/betaine transporter-like MFS transporter
MKIKKRKIAGAFLGTIVEYYDYSLYGFSAGILASKFFPELDKITSLMYVFGIYAISYFSKPLGSLVFSRIGDLYGRMVALKTTIIGIAIPTLAIGLLPDYNTIGAISVYILLICRFTQGFFMGGEYDGAAIYAIEHLGKKYHYTASAITRSTGVMGLLLGIAVTNFFNSSIFPDWAWRVPFLLSLPLALATIYFRKFLTETPDFTSAAKQNLQFLGIIAFIKRNWLNLVMVIICAGGFGVTYQISIIFMKQYLPIILPATSSIITSFSVLIVLVFGGAMPVAGFMADKFGKMIVIKISLLSTIIALSALAISIHYQIINLALAASLLLAGSVAPFNALAHGVVIKAFSVNERYRGVSLGHTIGSMLMSGTASYICLYVMSNYKILLFPLLYLGFFALLSFWMMYTFSEQYKKE